MTVAMYGAIVASFIGIIFRSSKSREIILMLKYKISLLLLHCITILFVPTLSERTGN